MTKAGRIISINPKYIIPGGEVIIECDIKAFETGSPILCNIGGENARIIGSSSRRVVALVPENIGSGEVEVYLEVKGSRTDSQSIIIGHQLADDLHMVSNPAMDPKSGDIIVTRSGSRGQHLPVTLFRIDRDDVISEIPADVMNPTGIAFDSAGQFFVTNRAEGIVCRINGNNEANIFATDLGIATGLAFDQKGSMYVGDRSGTIFRISSFDDNEIFAELEPSVAAYHMAFDPAGNLCITAPGLSSFDSVRMFDKAGRESQFYKGLGRPQGLAFDTEGNLYVAACLRGRRGIIKITGKDRNAELFISGMNIVGLCFTGKGEMVVATNEAVFSFALDIRGTLLN